MISLYDQCKLYATLGVEVVERVGVVGEYSSQQMVHGSGNIRLFCVLLLPERFTEFGRSK